MSTVQPLGPGAPSRAGSGIVTPAMVDLMCATRGWALVMAVVGWLTAVLMVVASVGLFAVSFAADGAAMLRLVAWPYLAMSLLMMVPAILLSRYTRALRSLREQRSERPLNEALHHEQRLWKFAAISLLVLLALAVAGIVAAIAIPALLK